MLDTEYGLEDVKKNLFLRKYEIYQKKKGYRYAMDPIILGSFLASNIDEGNCLEIGQGSLIATLVFLLKKREVSKAIDNKIKIWAIDIQPDNYKLSILNRNLNSLDESVEILEGDFRKYNFEDNFDVIYSNPPYFKEKTVNEPKNEEIAISKVEKTLTMEDIFFKAKDILKEKGKLILIYPYSRLDDLKRNAIKYEIGIKKIYEIYSSKDKEPAFILFYGEKGFKGEALDADFIVIYNDDGSYTKTGYEIFEEGNF